MEKPEEKRYHLVTNYAAIFSCLATVVFAIGFPLMIKTVADMEQELEVNFHTFILFHFDSLACSSRILARNENLSPLFWSNVGGCHDGAAENREPQPAATTMYLCVYWK